MLFCPAHVKEKAKEKEKVANVDVESDEVQAFASSTWDEYRFKIVICADDLWASPKANVGFYQLRRVRMDDSGT